MHAAFCAVSAAAAVPPHLPNATRATAQGVTPLKFVGHGTLRQRERRLKLSTGWRVEGNLHTLGYFAAEVCVGTPAKKFARAHCRPFAP
jgi:hypothetical protein